MTGGWDTRGRTRRSVLAGMGLTAALALAGCTVGGPRTEGSNPRGSSKPSKPQATLTTSITDGSVDVVPSTPLSVTVTGGTLQSVQVTTLTGAVLEGSTDEASLTWTADAPLEYGSTYAIAATATNPDGATTELAASFSTVDPTAQIFPSIGPLDGTVVGIAMPIRVYFDHAVTDRKVIEEHLIVTSSPAQLGGWNWISDTEVHWRPQVYWAAGTQVTVAANLFGVPAGGGAWGKVNRTISFDIGAHQVATCDTNEHQLHCFENGQLVRSFPIAAGKEETGRYTHSGIHVVTDKKPKMTMDSTTYGLALDAGGYQTEVEWATRISNNGEFVHAAPWSIADQGVRNVSHGCINASPEDAKWYQQWCQIGDPVEITGTPVPLTQADGDIFDWTIDWQTWQQGSAL